jgi:hypothetical protein
MTVNVSEMKKESESKYVVLQGNESKNLTFVSDDEKVIKVAKETGKNFGMREFSVRLEDGSIKKLSLFSKDAMKLCEVVAKAKGLKDALELKTLIDVKVTLIQSMDGNNKQVLDFKVIA